MGKNLTQATLAHGSYNGDKWPKCSFSRITLRACLADVMKRSGHKAMGLATALHYKQPGWGGSLAFTTVVFALHTTHPTPWGEKQQL